MVPRKTLPFVQRFGRKAFLNEKRGDKNMDEAAKWALQIIGVTDFFIGAVLVMFARTLVKRMGWGEKVSCDFEHEMTEQELLEYKNNKAVVNTKMIGMLISLPGLVIILYVFQ